MYKLLTLAFIVSISLVLTSCLHVPTESNSITSRSQSLRIYQDNDQITYRVEGVISSILEDSAGEIVINVQETDTQGNNLYVGTDGGTITEVVSGTPPNEVSEFRDESGKVLSGDELTGMKPKLTCANEDIELNKPCYEKKFLLGTLTVTWEKVDDLSEPISGVAIPVMEETWDMILSESDANFSGSTGPIIVDLDTKRYISQLTAGVNKGQIYVHALRVNSATSLDYDWVSAVEGATVGKTLSDTSPVVSNSETIDIKYDVKEGCDAAQTAAECITVATVTKKMTYPGGRERRNLGGLGIFSVRSISIAGGVERLQADTAAIDMGYEIFSNCDTETQGVTYPKTQVSYSVGDFAIFPDIGPIRIKYTCIPRYRISVDNATPIVTLDTSLQIDAVMTSTNIPYSTNK